METMMEFELQFKVLLPGKLNIGYFIFPSTKLGRMSFLWTIGVILVTSLEFLLSPLRTGNCQPEKFLDLTFYIVRMIGWQAWVQERCTNIALFWHKILHIICSVERLFWASGSIFVLGHPQNGWLGKRSFPKWSLFLGKEGRGEITKLKRPNGLACNDNLR